MRRHFGTRCAGGELDRNAIQGNRMAQRNQLAGLLRRQDARNPRDSEHISLLGRPVLDQRQRLRSPTAHREAETAKAHRG